MTDQTIDEDEDRLPWLESVDDGEDSTASPWRVILFAVLAIAAIGAILYTGYRLRQQRTTDGNGALIQAEPGPYKVRPDQPGGMKVDGEGDSVYSASQGATPNGSVDLAAVPEAPVAGKRAPAPKPSASPTPGGTRVIARVPDTSARLTPKASPAPAVRTAPMGGGGSVVQLGSFPSEASANAAWQSLSARFGYLAPLGKSVQQAEVKGRTVYRLRVNAGSVTQANEICGRLKVAGEPCFIPN